MVFIRAATHLYSIENFLFFILNLIVFQIMMYMPIRKFYKEKVSLQLTLFSSVFLFVYCLVFADYLERLFYGMIIVNGYLMISGVILVFSLFNFFIYEKDAKFQMFLIVEGLFMTSWFFITQFLTFYLYEELYIGSFGSFFCLLLIGVPIFIGSYTFIQRKIKATRYTLSFLSSIYVLLFLFLNTVNILIFSFKTDHLKLVVSSSFIGKQLLTNLNTHTKILYWNMDERLAMIFFFALVICIPMSSLIQLIVSKQQDKKIIQLQTKREEELTKYILTIESINKETRQLQHDIGNVLSSLGMYVYQDDVDILALRNYYDEVNQEFGLRRITKIPNGKLAYLKNPEILGLVLDKLMRSKDLGVQLNLELDDTIQYPTKRLVPIVRILAILLDNALEESKKYPNSKVRLAFLNVGEDQILVLMENQTDNLEFMKQYLVGATESDKGEGHGQGLRIVQKLLKENRQLHLDCKQTDRTVLFSFLVEGSS